ncbi:hypothetical protein MTO96_029452 [Rhipicephalus appendiculatus]
MTRHGARNSSQLVTWYMYEGRPISTSKFRHPYVGPYRLVRQTTENDWEVENRRGRRDIVNISRLKPYHSRAESAPAEDEATQPASPVHARDAQAPNDARSDAGDAKDDSDDEEFHDALDKPPEDATMPARPRRSVMPHQRDDFVYY